MGEGRGVEGAERLEPVPFLLPRLAPLPYPQPLGCML